MWGKAYFYPKGYMKFATLYLEMCSAEYKIAPLPLKHINLFTAGDEENNPKTPDAPSKEDLVREIEENPVFNAVAARIKLKDLITELSQN